MSELWANWAPSKLRMRFANSVLCISASLRSFLGSGFPELSGKRLCYVDSLRVASWVLGNRLRAKFKLLKVSSHHRLQSSCSKFAHYSSSWRWSNHSDRDPAFQEESLAIPGIWAFLCTVGAWLFLENRWRNRRGCLRLSCAQNKLVVWSIF